jgi:hypothetical protein
MIKVIIYTRHGTSLSLSLSLSQESLMCLRQPATGPIIRWMDLFDTLFVYYNPYHHTHIQDVPKLVIQKSAVISKLEATI